MWQSRYIHKYKYKCYKHQGITINIYINQPCTFIIHNQVPAAFSLLSDINMSHPRGGTTPIYKRYEHMHASSVDRRNYRNPDAPGFPPGTVTSVQLAVVDPMRESCWALWRKSRRALRSRLVRVRPGLQVGPLLVLVGRSLRTGPQDDQAVGNAHLSTATCHLRACHPVPLRSHQQTSSVISRLTHPPPPPRWYASMATLDQICHATWLGDYKILWLDTERRG